MYPGTITAPMHYENPVTGKPVYAVKVSCATATATATLADLAKRLARLEDARASRISAERLQLLPRPLAVG